MTREPDWCRGHHPVDQPDPVHDNVLAAVDEQDGTVELMITQSGEKAPVLSLLVVSGDQEIVVELPPLAAGRLLGGLAAGLALVGAR